MDIDEKIRQRQEVRKRWERKHAGHCIDCGKLISSYGAIRCHSCNAKYQFREPQFHPKWKGGRQESGGYIHIYMPDYPQSRNGYIAEHILIWEQAHGKPLPKGWVIHHLNGIKTDNRISNLVALPKYQHNAILAAKAKRIQELEAMLHQQGQLI